MPKSKTAFGRPELCTVIMGILGGNYLFSKKCNLLNISPTYIIYLYFADETSLSKPFQE